MKTSSTSCGEKLIANIARGFGVASRVPMSAHSSFDNFSATTLSRSGDASVQLHARVHVLQCFRWTVNNMLGVMLSPEGYTISTILTVSVIIDCL